MTISQEKVDRLMNAMVNMVGEMESKFEEYSVLCGGLSKRELLVLEFVGNNPNIIMREIAEFLKVPLSTVTGIVDKLVNLDHLVRQHSLSDRRNIIVSLSKNGKKTFEMFTKQRAFMGESILSALNEKEQDDLIDLLEKAAIHVKSEAVKPE